MKPFPLTELFSFDIEPFCSIVKFESGESILEEGTDSSPLYYLMEGRAKLFLTHENGRTSLVSFLDAPCFIGEMEFLGAQQCANGITAITPCQCYRIDTAACREQIMTDVKFLRQLCLFLSKKALRNTAAYSKSQTYPLENRLAAFILTTATGGVYREKHTETAEFLGVSYRHLLYVIAAFAKKGILTKNSSGYLITDPQALQDLADKVSTNGSSGL
ncbi:Regulatory protein YeiL [uncultured Eubacterium sp.]|nr:Regulatory protein YeiL [uncultured Eubacterium sp.]